MKTWNENWQPREREIQAHYNENHHAVVIGTDKSNGVAFDIEAATVLRDSLTSAIDEMEAANKPIHATSVIIQTDDGKTIACSGDFEITITEKE